MNNLIHCQSEDAHAHLMALAYFEYARIQSLLNT